MRREAAQAPQDGVFAVDVDVVGSIEFRRESGKEAERPRTAARTAATANTMVETGTLTAVVP
jgi:hypothetical protein